MTAPSRGARRSMSVEGLGNGLATAAAGRRRGTRAGTALAWARERLATTPGRLVLISISVVVGAVAFAVIATGAVQSRERAARAVRTRTEPLLVQAASLYTALSDANATEATSLLSGRREPAVKRRQYVNDLHTASAKLSALTRETGSSSVEAAALNTIADQLPAYSGLVESARANNLQGFPIGAAYLRQASQLSTSRMLPAADGIYTSAAQHLNANYTTGTATSALVTFIAASAVALILLLMVQWYLARISHRRLNIPIVAATVAVAAVSVWGVVGLVDEQSSLSTAQRNGSDPVEVLSAATVLQSRAQSDLSLTLVNRGTDVADSADFDSVQPVLGGLVDEISAPGSGTHMPAATKRFGATYGSYLLQADSIEILESQGQLASALALEPGTAVISEQLTRDLNGQIGAAQSRFARAASDATSSLGGLSLAIPLIILLAAVLAILGLGQRINEYR